MVRLLTVAGAAQVTRCLKGDTLLLPVELRCVNHIASTNRRILARHHGSKPYNATTMANNATTLSTPSQTDQIAERVERLLLRYAELQRTNALLQQQVVELEQERDSLKSRLTAARSRVDTLLERLPGNEKAAKGAP